MALKSVTAYCLSVAFTISWFTSAFAQTSSGTPQSFRDPAAKDWRDAITASNVEGVRALLTAAGTNDCLELDEQGRTALHYAVQQAVSDNTDPKPFTILKLLAARPGCVNAADRLGRKPILELEPLSWTSRSRMDTLAVLLANGADPNAVDENGATLLHQILQAWDASSTYWPELVPVLLKAGLKPNLVNAAGQTALHSFFGQHGFCANRDGMRESKVQVAQKVFELLTHAGADLTIRDRDGNTPVGLLLSQYEPFLGAKETILAFAQPSMASTLKVEAARIKNRPALIALCDAGRADPDLIERLLELKANPKAAESDGFTALHGAAWFYNVQVCGLLLDHGADVNAVDARGRTPLHELARSQYHHSSFLEADHFADVLRTAELLVEKGANRRLKDRDGKTAYDLLKGFGPDESDDQQMLRTLKKRLKP
jgi:ankyrin repeat protein